MNPTDTIPATPGSTPLTLQPAERRESLWRRFRRSSPLALVYAAAVLIFYTTIFVIPFATAIWLSFHNWDFLTSPVYVGLRNYHKALTDAYFWQALRTRRCATIRITADETRNGSTPMFSIRLMVLGASLVWSVVSTRCPVRAALTPISAVS